MKSFASSKNITTYSALGLLLFAGIFPFLANPAWITIGTTFLIYSCVAFSQDIILGRAGVFHMGHAMFFGMGAYTTAILNAHFGWSILSTWVPSVLFPMLAAVALAAPIIHLRGDYLLVASIGFNIVFIQILENDVFGLTGGPNGIFGLDVVHALGMDFGSPIQMYYLAFILLGITLFIMRRLDKSLFGRAMFYIHKDPIAAAGMGISIRFHKLYAFAVGAGIAGAAGSFFAVQYSTVSPETFDVVQSILFFTIVLVGGSASLSGVLLGAFVMFVVPEIFRDFKEMRYLVFGVAMILVMILRPHGILPVQFGKLPKFFTKHFSEEP